MRPAGRARLPLMAPDPNPGGTFLEASRTYLRDTYLPRLERALEALPPEDLWWRPHAEMPSVGHLLLHLAGNVRQWIVSGLGGAEDRRTRALEFAPETQPSREELLANLRATVEEACAVLAELSPERLTERRVFQSYDFTLLEAIYHVVEHFSWHTGQITTIAKQRAGQAHGIAFYDEARVNEAHNEPAAG